METPEQIADELVMNEPPPWESDADQRQSARIAAAIRAYADQQVRAALEQAANICDQYAAVMPWGPEEFDMRTAARHIRELAAPKEDT